MGCRLIAMLIIYLPLLLEAKNSGFCLISGDSSIPIQNGNDWVLTSGKKTIVEWDQFSLAKHERFCFQQADAQSAILNRVVGSSLSEIFGSITSNGRVILINPNGILIGEGGRIETAGFVASTFDLSNSQFLSNNEAFEPQGTGSIVQLGSISCPTGDVRFIGRKVENKGQIVAQKVFIETELGDLIEQVEEIDISPYQQAICHTGLIEGEEVLLWAKDSEAYVSGSIIGDKIHVLGDEIHLANQAKLNASSPSGGGEILVGGDYQGSNPKVPNALEVLVDPGVTLLADATDTGDGGKVIVWSDEDTSFFGKISARGGPNGGDGGLAEISSRAKMRLDGFKTNLSASSGKSGMLLLDPNDIVIGAAATTGTFIDGTYSIVTGSLTNQILNTDLQDQLANNSVTIMTTGSAGAGPNSGSITVSSTVSWATSNSLTMIANSFVSVSAAITNTGGGSMTLIGQGAAGTGYNGVTIGAAVSLTGTSGGVAGVLTISGNGRGASVSGVNVSSPITVNSAGSTTATSGTVIFQNCTVTSASGANCHGVVITSTIDAVNITATNNIQGGAGTSTCHGFFINGGSLGTNGSTTSGVTISITATTNGTSTQNRGIQIVGTGKAGVTVLAVGDNASPAPSITLQGLTGNGITSNNAMGIQFVNAKILVGSASDSTASFTASGTSLAANERAFGLETVGTVITVSGTGTLAFQDCLGSNVAGSNSAAGFDFHSTDLVATNGTVLFDRCTGGGANTGGATSCFGVAQTNGSTINAATITIQNITGGSTTAFTGGVGYYLSTSTSSITATGTLSLTSTGGGITTASGVYGFWMDNGTITGGNIAINGIGGTGSGGANHGIFLATGGSALITSASGTITLTGSAASTGASNGILITKSNAVTSSSGNIVVSGSSTATGASSHGVSVAASWAAGTTGTVTFSSCSGGSGNASHGINVGVGAAFSTSGNVVATSSIQSGTGSASVGFASGANFTSSGGTIQITASSQAATGACHGISLTGGSLSTTGGGTITLIGTAGASSTASHGVNLTGGAGTVSTTTGSGPISITGSASGSAVSFGVNISGSNAGVINSTSGTITVSGTSAATAAGSHGVSVAAAWTPATIGTVTFSGTGGGTGASHGVNFGAAFTGVCPVVFTSCLGGTGGGNGINNATTAFTTSGSVTATNSITGRGSGGSGFVSSQNFSSTGASTTITITASATGSSGVCNGISLTGGTMSTVGGAIALTGTGSASSEASVGILLSSANAITSTSGSITLVGLSSAVGANTTAYGVSITAAQSPGTSGNPAYSITGTGGATSPGINLSGAITSLGGTGAVSLTGTAGSGANFANNLNANITTAGGSITIAGSSILASSISLDSTNAGGAATGADITFSGSSATIDATSAGTQTLTLRAGTGGAVTFEGAIGAATRLGALTITSAKTIANAVNLGANITSDSFTITTASPVTLTNAVTINTSAAGGNISFPSTVDGAFAFILNAGTGSITFSSSVGSTTALASLSATANAISIEGNQTIAGAISYTGPVTIVGNRTITNTGSGGISFSSTITGPYDLSLIGVSTNISVSGIVTLSGVAVGESSGNLSVLAGSDVLFSSAIRAEGGPATGAAGASGGAVNIQSTGGSISVDSISTAGTNDVTLGGSGGNIILQPASGLTSGALGNIPNGRITLNGNLNAAGGTGGIAGTGGTIELANAGRAQFPSIATIVSSLAGNSVTIAGKNLYMGTNEVMTVFGSITCTLTSLATVSDMVALDSLTITAPSLTLVGHGTVQILTSTGALASINGGHLLARTAISAPVTSVVGAFDTIGLIDVSSQAALQALLTYVPNSYLLNYGSETIPATSPISQGPLIYMLGVASISFEDGLPLYSFWKGWPYFGKICPISEENCPHYFFESFLWENDVVKLDTM